VEVSKIRATLFTDPTFRAWKTCSKVNCTYLLGGFDRPFVSRALNPTLKSTERTSRIRLVHDNQWECLILIPIAWRERKLAHSRALA
jgi:hypothetical protein